MYFVFPLPNKLYLLIYFSKTQSVWSESTVLHILLFPSYLTLSLLPNICSPILPFHVCIECHIHFSHCSTFTHAILIPEMLSIEPPYQILILPVVSTTMWQPLLAIRLCTSSFILRLNVFLVITTKEFNILFIIDYIHTL